MDRDFHANRGALGIDGGRYLPDVADGGDVRIRDQRQRHVAVIHIAQEHRLWDIEDGITLAILRQRENRLGRLHDLPDFKASRCNHTRRTGVQFGIVERLAGLSQLRFCRFKRALCGSQLLLRLVVGNAGGEAGRDERGLPIKRGLGHAQLRLRRSDPCGRGIKLGLLLGRIEPRKNVTAIDTGTDIHQPRNHASTHPKREVGAIDAPGLRRSA